MNSNNDGLICAATTWGIALVAGTLAGAMLMAIGDWTFMQGAFVGLLAFLALGALLSLTMCRPMPAPRQPGDIDAAPVPGSDRATTTTAAAPSASATTVAPASAPAPAAVPAPAPEPSQAAEPAPTPTPAAAPSPTPGEGSRPAALDGPRGGEADDLKKIKGVGPKLEQLCNSLGFYHYDQIANWTADEVAWVDQNLKGFKGRVSRDNWVEQAKTLAQGGETEFSKRVDEGDVY